MFVSIYHRKIGMYIAKTGVQCNLCRPNYPGNSIGGTEWGSPNPAIDDTECRNLVVAGGCQFTNCQFDNSTWTAIEVTANNNVFSACVINLFGRGSTGGTPYGALISGNRNAFAASHFRYGTGTG